MINFKINGHEVSCDSVEEAAKLLFHKNVTVRTPRKRTAVVDSIPAMEYKTKKKRNRKMFNRWTEDEVSLVISNLHLLPSELASIPQLLRHTEKGITIMRNKLRSGQLDGMAKGIKKFARNEMSKIHPTAKRSLLDPVDLSSLV